MTKINTGGSALGGQFEPNHAGSNDREPWNHGMTLRDYFAAKAMQGLHATLADMEDWPNDFTLERIAKLSYKQADAMIKARGEDND